MARPSRPSGNLPAEATSFIGRRRELTELRKKLTEARLVSLVGPGGVGKTRLAIRVATDLARGFKNGAWLVELAEVRDGTLIGNAVIAALDLRDQAATEPIALLLTYLRDKDLLLVVDNCEHLLSAVAQLLTEVLRAAPGVRVVTTGREPLSAAGEQVVPVPPLELPSRDTDEPLAQLRHNEAVMLFADRAAAAAGTFELTTANRAAVVELCRRLDGLPLAIELAAVRTRVLAVEQIRDRLTDRFGLLTGGNRAALPRQQTLRTTIDWSYDLLRPEERALLRRLCVFAGRFTLDDVESVCASDEMPAAQALDLISSLVDKSLVIKEDAKAVACYRLHETMREYAGLKLREAGEEAVIEERGAEYYRLRCLREAFAARYRLVEWLAWMELEIDNVRSVLRRFLTQRDFARGIDLAVAVGWYWFTRATTEGVRWFDALLASEHGSPQTLAWAYFMRGFLAVLQADPAAAKPALERAIAEARPAGRVDVLSQALPLLSIVASMMGDPVRSARLLDDAEVNARTIDDPAAQAGILQARTLNGFLAGDLDAVRAASAEGARISRESGDLYALEMQLINMGVAAFLSGDLPEARVKSAEGLRIARLIDDRLAQYYALDVLGCVAASTGQVKLAGQLIGAAETIRTGAGASLYPFLVPLLSHAEASAGAALGSSRFEAEVDSGKDLGRIAAVALALGESIESPDGATAGARVSLLGKRELEVARLVADGLSNKQIGARLFISERTVDSHVRSILNKLGVNSRAQIASWMASSTR